MSKYAALYSAVLVRRQISYPTLPSILLVFYIFSLMTRGFSCVVSPRWPFSLAISSATRLRVGDSTILPTGCRVLIYLLQSSTALNPQKVSITLLKAVISVPLKVGLRESWRAWPERSGFVRAAFIREIIRFDIYLFQLVGCLNWIRLIIKINWIHLIYLKIQQKQPLYPMHNYLSGYLVCPTHSEPLNLACLDQNCDKRGIICCYCEYKEHKHPVRALGILFAEVEKDVMSYQAGLGRLARIDSIFGDIQVEIGKMGSQAERQSVKEMSATYFQHHIASIFRRNESAQSLKSTHPHTIASLNSFILSYNFVEKANKPSNLTNAQCQIQGKLEEFNNLLKQLKQHIKNASSMDKIMKLFEIDEQGRVKYYFNSEKSHRDIIVVDKTKAELKEGYSYRIGILDPPIRKQGGKLKRKTCTFKITKVTAMIGVGVIYKKKAQTANYLFSAYSQHGCYFISNSGYTYNESNSAYNSQIKNWNYTTGDVIKVTVEPKDKKILFEREGKDVFELPFEDKMDMELNFGVLLCQQNQSVEVLY